MEGEALQPKLDHAQRVLEKALDEACGVDVRKVNTDELIRIDETLAVASKAAKEAVSVRLRLRSQRTRGREGQTKRATPAAQKADEIPETKHRVFDDIRGKRWHVFAVYPSSATVERAALPETFLKGWLSFEATDEVRRFAPIPEHWDELTIEELRLLCGKAEHAPRRTSSPGNPDSVPPTTV
jgi:hypothetical protein